MIAVYFATVRIKSFHFGFSEGGLRPKRLTFDFISIQFLNLAFFPGTFIFFKSLIDTFSCDYAIVINCSLYCWQVPEDTLSE
jgi:hypothetical protein